MNSNMNSSVWRLAAALVSPLSLSFSFSLPLAPSATWVPLSSGAASCLMGSLYPLLDSHLLRQNSRTSRLLARRDWSIALRCFGVFIGVCYATSKLSLSSQLHMSITLAHLAVGMWYLFDTTIHGFLISLCGAVVGTAVVIALVNHGVYAYTQADLYGVNSW
eukprot:jgi/Hompol1/4200/HPOL_006987-RA